MKTRKTKARLGRPPNPDGPATVRHTLTLSREASAVLDALPGSRQKSAFTSAAIVAQQERLAAAEESP